MKAEEFKSSNIVNDCFNEECERVKNNTPNDIKSSQNINNDLTDRSCNKSHHANKSKSSSSYINHHLDESCLPPQEIDNSAILFSNTKRRETKLKNEQLLNALNPEENKSNHEGSIYDNSKVNYGENNNEEQSAGEGESYSSSCSCSSCLRERNADNGVSLKLSQYDYKPTYIDHQTLSDDEKTPNTQNQKYKKSLRKESSPRYFYKRNEDQECQSSDYSPSVNNKTIEDYPDNLNNGKFKFRMMK